MAQAWNLYFKDNDDVHVSCGDIFADGPHMQAEGLVSPANSFGFMDGGIDYVYSEFLGWDVGDLLRDQIFDEQNGEVPVGRAVAVDLAKLKKPSNFKYLISAPTMRVPMNVADTVNAYLAFSATLNTAKAYGIKSIVCPGLGTAIGEMPRPVCAAQMYEAVRKYKNPHMYPTLAQAHMFHHVMQQPKLYNEYLREQVKLP